MKRIHIISLKRSVIVVIMASALLLAAVVIYRGEEDKSAYAGVLSNSITAGPREQLLEEFSLFFLYPYIQDALVEYYGGPKQYWQDKVIDIKKVEIDYRNFLEITVQVETFEGAHNPPYGKDTITFRTKEYSISLKMINYRHEDN